MTEYTQVIAPGGPSSPLLRFASVMEAVATPVEMTDLPLDYAHVFVGVRFFDGAGVEVTGQLAAGTAAVSVRTWNTGEWETPAESSFDFTSRETISMRGTIEGITVTPAGVTGAVTYEVWVSAHES